MHMIHLELPSLKHKAQALKAVQPYAINGETMHGGFRLVPFLTEKSYEQWLTFLEEVKAGKHEGFVPADTYFIMEEEELVGIVNLRYELNDNLLQTGGHIGYSIQPDRRNRGYATQALRIGLEQMWQRGMSRVLVTCDVDNAASARVIEKCGGQLEDIRSDEDGFVKRYWIERDPS